MNEMKASDVVRMAQKSSLNGGPGPMQYVLFGTGTDRDYCSYYWSSLKHNIGFESYKKAVRLANRYRRFHRYCTEVLPEWTTVDEIHYMDNSVYATQIAKDRVTTRRVMIKPSSEF